jgi:ribosomal protein S18 acetylase RimI-like enzyme
MDFKILLHDDIIKQDLTLFVNIIYNNFIDLVDEPKLMHNKEKILEILQSYKSVLLVALDKKVMVGFVLGEILELDDRRTVFYISYIYVATSMRTHGLGSQLMDYAENFAANNNCLGVMLIFDTHKSNLVRFYEKRGYMLDINLRRYERHDVFYKVV